MTNLTQELREFTEFVEHQAKSGLRHASLDDAFQLWRDQRERAASIAAIREGLDDVRAGRIRPAEVVIAELKERLGRRPSE